MLNRNSDNISNVVHKLSKFVRQYANENNVAKYLENKEFLDNSNLAYNVMIINKNKLFSHTSFFKNYKTELEMINHQGKTPVFYSSRDSWMNDKHSTYLTIELLIYKIFNTFGNETVTKNDLSEINELYKKFNRDIIKKVKK